MTVLTDDQSVVRRDELLTMLDYYLVKLPKHQLAHAELCKRQRIPQQIPKWTHEVRNDPNPSQMRFF